VNSRLILLCLLGAFYQAHCQTAATNLTAVIDCGGLAEPVFMQAPGSNLLATGDWSKALEDDHGHKIRSRITVYESAIVSFTTGFNNQSPGAKAAEAKQAEVTMPQSRVTSVYLEIQDLQGTNKTPTQIYFHVPDGLHVELRDANGAPADKLRPDGGAGGVLHGTPGFWATVPSGGLLRLHANSGRGASLPGAGGGLNLQFRLAPHWIIPGGDTNAYFLSAVIAAAPADSSPAEHNAWQGPLQFPAVKVVAPRN
jgi:hypothetical protein